MRENLDIMARESVEEYVNYFNLMKERMDDLVEETNRVASKLDENDDNDHTRKMQNFLESMAENARQASGKIYEEIVECFLRELEEKNDAVGSRRQEDYIAEIRAAARKLEAIKAYRPSELAGEKAFDSEMMDEFLKEHIAGLVDKWMENIDELKQEANERKESMEQDEMSETMAEVSAALERMSDQIADSASEVGGHILDISERHDERKKRMTQAAEEKSSEIQGIMQRMLGEAQIDFTNIHF